MCASEINRGLLGDLVVRVLMQTKTAAHGNFDDNIQLVSYAESTKTALLLPGRHSLVASWQARWTSI